MKTKTVLIILLASLACATFSQARQAELPENFVRLSGQNSVESAIREANSRAENNERFWVGYRTDLRDDLVRKGRVYIHDNGGVSWYHGDENWFWDEDNDDLKTTAYRALAEMGDDEAKEELKKRRRQVVMFSPEDYAIYFLLDKGSSQPQRVQFLHFDHVKRLRGIKTYWAAKLPANGSFSFLKNIVENAAAPDRVRKPAVFLTSLHDTPETIPFLKRTAASDEDYDVRKTATFWLSQIPVEESFDALLDLYEKEESIKLKGEIVFALSQHKSERSTPKLAEIARSKEPFHVREKAVFWLGQTNEESALDVLQEIYDENADSRLKEKIIFSISQHKSERSPKILIDIAENDSDRHAREKAIFWLGQIAGKKSLEVLRGIVVDDDETKIQEKAVFAISQNRDRDEATKILLDIARNHKNPHVRKKAIFWLGQTDKSKALELYKDILKN